MLHYFRPIVSLGKTSLNALKLDKIKVFKLGFLFVAAIFLYFTVKEATHSPVPSRILINLGVFLWLIDFALNADYAHEKKITLKMIFKREREVCDMSPFSSLAHILAYVGLIFFTLGFVFLFFSY